jgi:hypothetical protein
MIVWWCLKAAFRIKVFKFLARTKCIANFHYSSMRNFHVYDKFVRFMRSAKETISFSRDNGIVLSECNCENTHSMNLYISDWIFWQYIIKAYRKKVNMRVGSWFENNLLFFVAVVCFIYRWAHEEISKWCRHSTD